MPNPGDKVKVITEKEEFTGILMPRPTLLEKGFTIIKLDNGYNIGIDNKKIKKIELIKKYSPKKIQSPKIKFNPKLPTVSILHAPRHNRIRPNALWDEEGGGLRRHVVFGAEDSLFRGARDRGGGSGRISLR